MNSQIAGKPAGNDQPLIAARKLTVGYQHSQPVIKDLDLCISAPLVHLRGTNGSGKSTLIEVIAGNLEPWQGTIQLLGELPATERARASRCICRAEPALVPVLSVRSQVEIISRGLGMEQEKIFERLERYGLGQWFDTPAGELSTGNLKKAWHVLTTAQPRPLMILDEPFNGLDSDSVHIMSGEIKDWMDQGCNVVIVAHDLPYDLHPEQVVRLAGRQPAAVHGADG